MSRVRDNLFGMTPHSPCHHWLTLPDAITSIGASPEAVFQTQGRDVLLDVVAGTDTAGTNALAALLADPKEVNEHLMALQRGLALGATFCVPETLTTKNVLSVRCMGSVTHLRSEVCFRLKRGVSWQHVFRACHPALVSYPHPTPAEYEPGFRCFYGGIVGYLDMPKETCNAFLNLRSIVALENAIWTHGGVGITDKSNPPDELKEVQGKLAPVFVACEAGGHT